MDDDFLLVPADRVAEIAGVSRQRLWYWEKSKLVKPTHRRVVNKRLIVRLYDLADLTVVAVVAELVRLSGITLQHVRKTRGLFISRDLEPLRDLRWAVARDETTKRRELFVQYPDGTWEGDRKPGQKILDGNTLDLELIRSRVSKQAHRPSTRDKASIGHVEKRHQVRGSAPVFSGTRIPLEAVWEYLSEGASDSEILVAYPGLRTADVDKARLLLDAARRVKVGSLSADKLAERYSQLSAAEIRSIRELSRVA
jgi:uncharacterized protein (DUF433 family)